MGIPGVSLLIKGKKKILKVKILDEGDVKEGHGATLVLNGPRWTNGEGLSCWGGFVRLIIFGVPIIDSEKLIDSWS